MDNPASYAVEIELAAKLAEQIGQRKLQQARKDNAPPTYCAAVEATTQEISDAIRQLGVTR